MFVTKKDSEKIKSIQATDILVDECTELTYQDYQQLKIRVREHRLGYNQLVFCFNPISKNNWVYKEFFENGIPKNTIICKSTFLDNPYLGDDYKELYNEMKARDYNMWLIYANGEFASEGETIYTNYKIEEVPVTALRKQKVKAYFGLDVGWNDPTALIAAFVDVENRKMWIFDEHYESGMITSEIAYMIKERGYAKEEITIDSQEKRVRNELKRSGIHRVKPAFKGKDSIAHGIAFIQSFDIIVDPSCTNTIRELQEYSWKVDKKTNAVTNKPMDEENHLMDAMRYMVRALMPKQRVSTFNKAYLGL